MVSINISTKSGTNEWHGSAYEYLRNRVLNSNEFFLKTAQLQGGKENKPPPFTQNQFGGTVGGAAIKNKTLPRRLIRTPAICQDIKTFSAAEFPGPRKSVIAKAG